MHGHYLQNATFECDLMKLKIALSIDTHAHHISMVYTTEYLYTRKETCAPATTALGMPYL